MDPVSILPKLLAAAWLIPLASFVLIVFFGPRMGKAGNKAGYVATAAIGTSCALSLFALFFVWLPNYGVPPALEHAAAEHVSTDHAAASGQDSAHADTAAVRPIVGDWYTLGKFGALQLTIGYYIDSLTVLMFSMVTIIATLIHFYANGYMHDELHEVVDHEVRLSDGHHLHR